MTSQRTWLSAALTLVGIGAALLGGSAAVAEEPTAPDLSAFADRVAKWEADVARFEAMDRAEPDPEGAVLLLGSSSIRLWETAASDLAPYPVVRRGYGGASLTDLAFYAKRLITPHKYRAAVVFVANDITGGGWDKEPEEIGELFGYVADVLTHHEPEAQVICCDVRPAPSRFHVWDKTRAGNAALKAECEKRPHVHYLDTADVFLSEDGSSARPEWHRQDMLHLNAEGYEVWSKLIKDELDRVLGE